MYRVVRRIGSGAGGLGTYLVEFSTELPREVRRAYLIGDFNSWSLGSAPLTKVGSRGYVRLVLPRGVFRYAYYLGRGVVTHDREVGSTSRAYVPLVGNVVKVSTAYVGVNDESLDVSVGDVVECLGNYCLVRLAIRESLSDWLSIKYVCMNGSSDSKVSLVSDDALMRYGKYSCLEYLVPCELSKYSLSFKGGSKEWVRVSRKSLRTSWLWDSVVLEVAIDDVMDRYDDVLVTMRYLGANAVRLRITPHSFIRPEDMLDLGEGGSKEVAGLVRSLSAEGASVILDLPLTYVTPCFRGFLDVIELGSKSSFRDWFVVLDDSLWRGVGFSGPSLTTKSSCYVVYELMKELRNHDVIELETVEPPTLRLNLNSLGVMGAIERTIKFWVRVGCRGLVISRSYGIPSEYLTAASEVAKGLRSDAVVLGESLTTPTYQLINSGIDGVIDYGLGLLITEFVRGALDLKSFATEVMIRYVNVPLSKALSTYVALPEEPICSLVSEDEAKLAYASVLALPGPLTIKFSDVMACGRRFRSFIKVLTKVVRDVKSLRLGLLKLSIHDSVLVTRRYLVGDESLVVINASSSKRKVRVRDLVGDYKDLVSGGLSRFNGKVKLRPKEVLILKKVIKEEPLSYFTA